MTHGELLSDLPILVVDDDATIRALFSRALTRAGLTVIEAASGFEALQAIADQRIAVALIDNHMPGMDGIEVVRRLRASETTSAIPIILVTGSDAGSDRVSGLDTGANDFISKTTPLQELVARVRAQLRSRAAWADLVTRELDGRARVVASLGKIPPGSLEETAGAILERLSVVSGVVFLGLVAVDAGDVITPLATWASGRGVTLGGSPLAPSLARMLLQRTTAGPWMDRVGASLPSHGGMFDPAEVGYTATAPLDVGDRVVGFLTVGVPPGTQGAPGPDLLAATIDYAGVAGAILGSGLISRGHESEARGRLADVLAQRRFHPVFQPVLALKDRRVVGFEALTRFDDETPADLRFAEAARAGMGRQFEEAAIGEALRAGVHLPARAWLSVNLSPALTIDAPWLTSLAAGVSRSLVLELTEHAQIEDYAALREALAGLRPPFRIAIDDAGAGHSSLRHILELRPDFVKLDMTLVRGIEGDEVRQALVAGLAYFASRSGSALIAEGIETEAEARMLTGLGVPLGQGFLFGQPGPPED
jgi:EAL domain-containing protein (putative c-di-GMP-specific phosphodiesterase class I)/CheY-like chemotaxis protein